MEVVEDLRRGVSYVCPLKRAVDRRDYREITDHPSIIIAQHPDTVVQFTTHNAVFFDSNQSLGSSLELPKRSHHN